MFSSQNYFIVTLVFLVTFTTVWDPSEAFDLLDFVCVVGPPVVDTHSSKPITLHGIVDGFFQDSRGYSITFSSRDDGSIVTNGNIARFGKIGTQKGEKGDKGEMGSTMCSLTPGDPGDNGLDGSASAPGPPGDPGCEGFQGFPGSTGSAGSPGTDGKDEVYCVGEIPSCVQGPKGSKGVPGDACLQGMKGEKGEPPYPSLLGPQGQKGDMGSTGSTGPSGGAGDPGNNGINAPQAICETESSTTGSPGINLEVGFPGDQGDPGVPGFGPKGPKGMPGIPATVGGTPGSQGTQGSPGAPGPAGFPGGTISIDGENGLFIRPLFQGFEGPSCVSNVPVAVEKLSLYEPKADYMKDMRFGVFYCDFFSRGEDTFHVPTLLYNQDELIPADAKRTFIVSVGDELSLCVDSKLPKKYVGQLEWVLNGNKTDKLERWSGSNCIHIKCVEISDAGIYEAFRRPVGRNAKQHAYFIVIVRECPDGKYNAPACDSDCSLCENGYCDASSGSCICFSGFSGGSCTPNGEGLLGSGTGEIPCLDLGYGRSCEGALVCTETTGCTCASGWKGIHCDEPCESGTYGPDCCFDCPDTAPVCNRFTGLACET